MPTYQYRCKDCEHEFDIVQSFSDEPLDTCPECQGPLKKVYGNVGISFKGSGFYKTDSRKSSSSTASKPSKDLSKDRDSSSSSTSSDASTSSTSGSGSGDKATSSTSSSSD